MAWQDALVTQCGFEQQLSRAQPHSAIPKVGSHPSLRSHDVEGVLFLKDWAPVGVSV